MTSRLPVPEPGCEAASSWVTEHLGDLAGDAAPPSRRYRGGQRAADAVLAAYDVAGCAARRNEVWPAERRGASGLSPYIRHGLLTLTRVWTHVGGGPGRDVGRFRDELLWQEYARHLYARLGERTSRALRFDAPQVPPWEEAEPWLASMACVAMAREELERGGWLVNQTRMWLASQWSVCAGAAWREGEDLFFRHLLDGSRAANRLGWQWTVGTVTGKSYGSSWEEFVGSPVDVLMLGKSDCAAYAQWSSELEAHLGDASRWPEVRFGKVLLDTPGLAGFKRANPWLADLDDLPSTQIHVRGERVKSFAGGGVSRLESQLRRIAVTGKPARWDGLEARIFAETSRRTIVRHGYMSIVRVDVVAALRGESTSQSSPLRTESPEPASGELPQPGRHSVVVLGGGFGGLYAAKRLRRAAVEITLVDRRNFHLFQPLLYQVATGGLSPGDISSPIRRALRMQRNARVLLGEAVGLDAARRFVELRDGERLPYDTLVVATGARHHYFGNEEWEQRAPGLKSVEDATEMRRRILLAFERAERERDPATRRALLNFVIVGAGPTGVELAGAICELARDTLRHDFRSIDPRETRVLLVEGADRVLPIYPPDLSAKARKSLERLGAEVRVKTLVKGLDQDGVTLESGGQRERVPARCVLWAAGVRASSLARVLEKEAGASLDRAGRLLVEPDCSLPGHPEIFAIGDIANFSHQGDAPLPGVAPVAMQQGRYVARAIGRRLEGREVEPFRYRDKGSMATIGRKAAVADFGRIRFGGFPAWLLWSAVHVFFLIEYENRVLVALRWLWNYVTRNRGTRLITGSSDVA